MDPTSTDFEELTTHWSSGDNLYGSGCQLSDATPNRIFAISFSNESNQFFSELIKNKQSSNSSEPKYNISQWKNIPKQMDSGSKCTAIKQRKLSISATESGIAFFLRKNIVTNIVQTAFFHEDSIIIYSVAQTRTETKESDHLVIDRWSIEASVSDPPTVSVAINANILWKTYQIPTATIIKSKWLRFYQSRFATWRNLMKSHLQKYTVESEKMMLIEPFLGIWNKLHSTHSITIMTNKIKYSDGSQFAVSVNSKTNEIIATYAKSIFSGTLHKNDTYDEIRWNNGSVWIKDGFGRLEGEYLHKETQQKYAINGSGAITLPVSGRKVKYILTEPNRISYNLNKNVTNKGTVCCHKENEHMIKWDNGSVWRKINVNVSIKDEAAVNEHIAEQKSNKKTAEIEGEGETEELDSMPSIQIERDDHFVFINNDEIFGMQCCEDHKDDLDEWLLV